jgi:hypothetical protein
MRLRRVTHISNEIGSVYHRRGILLASSSGVYLDGSQGGWEVAMWMRRASEREDGVEPLGRVYGGWWLELRVLYSLDYGSGDNS